MAARRAEQVSFVILALSLALVTWLHLATPLLTILFAYFALTQLHAVTRVVRLGKWSALVLFLVLLAGVVYAFEYFLNEALARLPEIADRAIPSFTTWAREMHVELPFSDHESLKALALDTVKHNVKSFGRFFTLARGATRQVVFVVVGCVVAASLFFSPRFELDRPLASAPANPYSLCCDRLARRFSTFYGSFAMVMGAQLLISAVNTLLTAVFVLVVGLPHPVVVIGGTFLCGLLPLIGNLISNTIIVGIGFTVSPRLALVALIFLIVVHKLEYFLNSRIVGTRIRMPVWLTLLGLLVGEELMGIPGMILAPVLLHYVKVEASSVTVPLPDKPQVPDAAGSSSSA